MLADAHYAAFYAAEAALLALGETRSKHSGVVAAVAQVAVRRYGLDPQAGRLLRSLFDRRSQADYGRTSCRRGRRRLRCPMPSGSSTWSRRR